MSDESRIVESGPIKIEVDTKMAIQLLIEHILANLTEEGLKQFVKEWVAERFREQAVAQAADQEQQGENTDG